MSIYSDPKPIKPLKTVTQEYFEEVEKNIRRIRVVTTTCDYNSGSNKSEPNVSVNYHYL